jgi:hypothetical protein
MVLRMLTLIVIFKKISGFLQILTTNINVNHR